MSDRVIELVVANHPGVMSHVTGLFTRRAYNLEGILCGPIGGDRSRIWLLVAEDARLPQLVNELSCLYDVVHVGVRDDCDAGVFKRLDEIIG